MTSTVVRAGTGFVGCEWTTKMMKWVEGRCCGALLFPRSGRRQIVNHDGFEHIKISNRQWLVAVVVRISVVVGVMNMTYPPPRPEYPFVVDRTGGMTHRIVVVLLRRDSFDHRYHPMQSNARV